MNYRKPITILLLFAFFAFGLFTYSKVSKETVPTNDYNEIKNRYAVFDVSIPQKLEFASEEVPLNIYYVNEQLDRELLINTYWQSNALLFFKRANRWFPTIEKILAKNNVPLDFKYLAIIESGLLNVSSPAGAKGYWQFMKKTGQQFNLEINDYVDERLSIERSTEAACSYLKSSYRVFGSWTLAAASYNMGTAGLSSKLEKQLASNYYDLDLNAETERYVFRILAIKCIFENPRNYGFILRQCDLYPELETKEIIVDSSISNLAQFTQQYKVSYRLFKELNPWLIGNSLPNPTSKPYTIKLPETTLLQYSTMKQNMSSEIGIFGNKKQ